MSQHGTNREVPLVGYLRSCMDRRFVEATRSKFEHITQLPATQYYHEAFAGGALNPVSVPPPNRTPMVPTTSIIGLFMEKETSCWR